MATITLTTDFGLEDWFVGAMKGVILAINPRATVVDVTHGIGSGDIRAGAFALAASYRVFSKGTIHIAVVDPGVGSDRKAIAVETANYLFVAPDNGILSLALAKQKILAVRALENEKYFLHPLSRTFHGRDIFAPVAAHLSCGVPLRKLGPPLKDFRRISWPEPRLDYGKIEGEVIYIDRFGNAITNIQAEMVGAKHNRCEAYARRRQSIPLKDFYQAVSGNHPVAVIGSSGFLEVAVNGGSASKVLGLKIGTRVILRSSKPEAYSSAKS